MMFLRAFSTKSFYTRCLASFVLVLASCALSGCQYTIPTHEVANWRGKPNFMVAFGYTPPGSGDSVINSCAWDVPETLQCNGHGKCVEWRNYVVSGAAQATRLSFCHCDTNWADPECKTQRLSQVTTFFLSLFFGVFGVDQFYLGYIWPYGVIKLLTLGGFGLWYLFDLVRIAASPVLTAGRFRVAADLPHWAAMLILISAMCLIGFGISILSILYQRLRKAREIMVLQAEEAMARRLAQGKKPFAEEDEEVQEGRESQHDSQSTIGQSYTGGEGRTDFRGSPFAASTPDFHRNPFRSSAARERTQFANAGHFRGYGSTMGGQSNPFASNAP